MRLTLLAFILTLGQLVFGQTTADFESFGLEAEMFLNGSDGSMGFDDGNIRLINDYNTEWASWSGWAISNMTDTTTPGFSNQYSSISGDGANGSATYATSYVAGQSLIYTTNSDASGYVYGLYLNNATYTYLSMLEGDSFAKKFGGEDGTDPDFFYVSIKPYGQAASNDSIIVYLADYRSDDSSEDYILDEWTYVSLSGLGPVDTLSFQLYSSDIGAFGMNTPAYFCIDEVTTNDVIFAESTTDIDLNVVSIYPNPCKDYLSVDSDKIINSITCYDYTGKIHLNEQTHSRNHRLDISELQSGYYALELKMADGTSSYKKLYKN